MPATFRVSGLGSKAGRWLLATSRLLLKLLYAKNAIKQTVTDLPTFGL